MSNIEMNALIQAVRYLRYDISDRDLQIEISWIMMEMWKTDRGIRWGALSFGKELKARLSEVQRHKCIWCNEDMDPNAEDVRVRPTFDHIIPLVDGGEDNIDNIAIAHQYCNAGRKHKENISIYEICSRQL
jgi:5-methylcytosine-specific restriction endonuclease McrA